MVFQHYRQMGWMGTVKVNWETELEPGETETKCLSRLKPGVLIDLHCPSPPSLRICDSISHSVGWLRSTINPVADSCNFRGLPPSIDTFSKEKDASQWWQTAEIA